jgi:hypothetical protein
MQSPLALQVDIGCWALSACSRMLSELAVALMPPIAVVTSVPQFEIYDMAFTNAVITRYAGFIEKFICAKRRPPLHLRNNRDAGLKLS